MDCCSKKEEKSNASNSNQNNVHHMDNKRSSIPKWYYLCGAGLVVAVILVTVFKVSISNIFLYGIFLACPLMHIFMMKGHGGHHDAKEEKTKN